MTVTTQQYDNLVNRVEFLEAVINNLINALSRFATLDQVNQLTLIRQTEIDNMSTRLTAAENEIEQLGNLLAM